MKPILICYARCTTCQKAKKWLEAKNVAFDERPIKEQCPTAEELKAWRETSGLPLKKFFNTSGQTYRAMGLSEKLQNMTEDDMFELLASDGMLVKRPLLIGEKTVLVGFREAEWEQALL